MREPSRLLRLKAQYGQLVLRDRVRDDILQAIDEHSEAAERTPRPARTWRSWTRRRSLVGTGVVFALGLAVFLVWGAHTPVVLDGVVATVAGESFTGDSESIRLTPKAHVPEGQRVRTSPSGSVETRIGKHLVVVEPDSDLQLERLRAKDLRFRLERGAVTMTVSPLGRGGQLTVVAGELSVQVVGTVFTVERRSECSRVAVRSGRVSIAYKEIVGAVSAGESREFCPAKKTSASLTEQPVATGTSVPAAATRTSPTSAARSAQTPRKLAYAEPTWPVSPDMSDEERLFRDASRPQGAPWVRARKLQDYLVRFPDGLFAEDALFHLVRLSYADGNSAEVVRLSEQFLRRRRHGRRAVEVQLLYAQSAVELGLPPDRSRGPLESTLAHLDLLPRSQREQATYLAIVAYCGAQRTEACSLWVRRYLAEFPAGTYTNQVRRHRLATDDAP